MPPLVAAQTEHLQPSDVVLSRTSWLQSSFKALARPYGICCGCCCSRPPQSSKNSPKTCAQANDGQTSGKTIAAVSTFGLLQLAAARFISACDCFPISGRQSRVNGRSKLAPVHIRHAGYDSSCPLHTITDIKKRPCVELTSCVANGWDAGAAIFAFFIATFLIYCRESRVQITCHLFRRLVQLWQ